LEEGGEEGEEMNRTDEDCMVVTARVHVVLSDRAVRKIWVSTFWRCNNLVKVTAPFVEEVGESALMEACNQPPPRNSQP